MFEAQPIQSEHAPLSSQSYGRKGLRLLDHGDYREAYGMHASNGILFNHEGPTCGETFVTRKITRRRRHSPGTQDCLYLGNMEEA